jgi:DNA-binding response OmpR family regulator
LGDEREEALILLKERSADLIIFRLVHARDGRSFLLKACKQNPVKQIPFVMMSTRPEHGVQALEAGAHAYLLKPFSPDELEDVLRRVASSGR